MIGSANDASAQLYVNQEDRTILMALLSKNGIVEKFETMIFRKDKSTGWISINARAVKNKNAEGNILYLEGTVEDITERKRAEEELKITHQRLYDIIEFLPDATIVIDQEKKVVAWNRACEEMTNVSKEDIIGKADYAYAIPFYGEEGPS